MEALRKEQNEERREPLVSVIVPVYNAGEYLEQCIDSILAQRYEDFELLLMDDGSNDGSEEICDRYAGKDSRVRVIHKANSGVSDTRNQGIREARGRYLQFVDSDDWLAENATGLLVQAATENDCDMVIADFYRVVGDRFARKGDIEEEGLITREEFASCMMEDPADFYYGVLWNKLYRRDIIVKYGLAMDETISWCEDFMFNLEYILYGQSFYVLHAPVYYYRRRKGSLATQGMNLSKSVKMKLTVFEYYHNFYKHVLDEKEYEKNRLQVYRFLVDSAGDGMVLPSFFPGIRRLTEEKPFVWEEAFSCEDVLIGEYRNRKLLAACVSRTIEENGISFRDARLVLWLNRLEGPRSRKELSDITGISRSGLAVSLQVLAARGFLKTEEWKAETPKSSDGQKKASEKRRKNEEKNVRKLKCTLLAPGRELAERLEEGISEFERIRMSGFTQEEAACYREAEQKICTNIRQELVRKEL